MKQAIHTDNAPKALGPYSQAVRTGNLLFLSGQIPLDPKTNELVGDDVEAQTHQVMKNLASVLKSEGLDFNNVVKCSIFLQDLSHFPNVNEVYATYLQEPYPARACVEVAKLPKAVLVEIEAIACYPN